MEQMNSKAQQEISGKKLAIIIGGALLLLFGLAAIMKTTGLMN